MLKYLKKGTYIKCPSFVLRKNILVLYAQLICKVCNV